LPKQEQKILINPLLAAIKEFYKNPQNKILYEEWQEKRKTRCLLTKADNEFSNLTVTQKMRNQ
jgi:hypothetical protein